MSYVTGTFGTFLERLHQTPTGIIDLNFYQLESNNINYSGILSENAKDHWNREWLKKASGILNFPTGNLVY